MVRLFAAMVIVSITLLATLSLLASSSLRSVPQNVEFQDGAIVGRVLDAEGHPIIGMTVLAERSDIIIRPTPRAWTNKEGEFAIEGLMPGLYTLNTRKDEDGYPHTAFNFYDEGETVQPAVQVYAHQTTQNVIIQRGLKAAVLEGRVTEVTTNRPIQGAQITVRRVDHPERFLSTGLFWHGVDGGFRFLVPSLAFTLKVSAPGYEDWYYRKPGEGNRAGAFLLGSGTTKKLFIALRPRRRSK